MGQTMNNMARKILDIYRTNPYLSIVPYRLTRPRVFWESYRFLKISEEWSSDQIWEWQFQKVKDIVLHAFANVPFYQNIYREVGFEPGDFTSLETLKLLPAITKQDIKNNPVAFIAANIKPQDYFSCQTSGSTASPMKFYQDYSVSHIDTAFHYYIWEKHGYTMGQKCVVFRGNKVAQPERHRYHIYDRFVNYKIFDSDHISSPDCLPYYDKEIKKFHANVIFGYPSSIYSLARAYDLTGIQPPHFKLITMSSENVDDEQMEYIRSIFSADMVTFNYGHTERVVLGNKYFMNNQVVFFPQYGFFELLDQESMQVTTPGMIGEITGTGYSRAMPFIRYRTNDFATASTFKSEDFMKHCTAVERIEGRLQEFVVTSDKRLVSLVSVAGAHLEELCVLMDMQYQQDCVGELSVNGVENPSNPITADEINKIISSLERKFEYKIKVKFQKVDQIKRTSANKKLMLAQNLDVSNYKNLL